MFRFSTALVFALTSLCALSAHAAGSDGFWNAKYKDGQRGELDISYTQLGDAARLELDIVHWRGSPVWAKCVYAIGLEFGQPKTVLENSAGTTQRNTAAPCPQGLGFQIGQAGPGTLDVSFDNPVVGRQKFKLFGILRNPVDIPPVQKPLGFDILGISPTMTRTKTEAALYEKGYKPLNNLTKTILFDGDFTTTNEFWGKGGDRSDVIALSYSPLPAGSPDTAPDQKLVVVSRDWHIPMSDNLSVGVLDETLNKKYGHRSDALHNRFYGPNGVLQAGAVSYVCLPDSYIQDSSWRYYVGIDVSKDEQFKPNCGVSVAAHVTANQSTGLASQLNLTLKDGRAVYQAFWTVWAAQESAKLKGMLSSNYAPPAPSATAPSIRIAPQSPVVKAPEL